MNLNQSVFTISLDFELYWGLRDKRSIDQYQEYLGGVQTAIPEMLSAFRQHGIHATWATVGFLFFHHADELKANTPESLPNYDETGLSPYQYLASGHDLEAKYHFAPEMINLIRECKGQEIGSHTFSHYYCLEAGQTATNFQHDLHAAIRVSQEHGIPVKSLVFPRNQTNQEYCRVLHEVGIQCYRGNESHWIYRASKNASQGKLQRALRFLDAYFNITGHHVHDFKDCIKETPFNFASSRFLRPYSKRLAMLDGLRLKRIQEALCEAAVNGKMFHLWWHPHNFGIHTKQNMDFLMSIISYYHVLRDRYGMVSLNLGELAEQGLTALGKDGPI